jgi:hypothetical protein
MLTKPFQDIHNDTRVLTFYDFLNSLIKVSILIRTGMDNSNYEGGAGGCFEYVVFNHIHRTETEENITDMEVENLISLNNESVLDIEQTLEDTFRRPLIALYCHYVSRKTGTSTTSSLTVRDIVQVFNVSDSTTKR